MTNASYRWTFTLNEQEELELTDTFRERFTKLLKEHAKKWKFQKEIGGEGTLHYQGRLALKKKLRKSELINQVGKELNIAWFREGDEQKSEEYVGKEDGRVDGPWSSDDKSSYIPRKIRTLELQGWQRELEQALLRNAADGDDRTVHCILDRAGGIGKSTFCRYMSCKRGAIVLPGTIDTPDNLMKLACTSIGNKKEGIILLLDLPRAIGKNKAQWEKWVTTLEQLKGGHLTDWRYAGKNDWTEPIAIAVFTNTKPPTDSLSARRWNIMLPGPFDGRVRSLSPVRDVIELD